PQLPEGRSDRVGEVPRGDEVALFVHGNRKLGERASRGTENRLRVRGGDELRLVARAEDALGLGLVERRGAAQVRADLRVGVEVAVVVVLLARRLNHWR